MNLEGTVMTGDVVGPAPTGGVKHDGGKLPWHLLPWDAVAEMVGIKRIVGGDENDDATMFSEAQDNLTSWFHGEPREQLAHALLTTLEWLSDRDMTEIRDDGDEFAVEFSDLPWDAIEQVVRVMQFGAQKYAARNWERGLEHSRTFAAAQRHLIAFHRGERLDPETQLDHRAHAACEMLFALAFEARGRSDLDDRPRLDA